AKNLTSFIQTLQREAEKIQIVTLTVAYNFPEPDLKEMAYLLTTRVGRPVALDISVERSLIGGVIVQYGNYITDYSVRASLNQFREHWHRAVVQK
ncbi:F0F1 ATP synthase subunit delta, partial [Patescibacteria group bacterium]|nr:F0F1 ATP synthase subunit delta [Patescibacteria group bacterium]